MFTFIICLPFFLHTDGVEKKERRRSVRAVRQTSVTGMNKRAEGVAAHASLPTGRRGGA